MAFDALNAQVPRAVFIGSGTRGPFTFNDTSGNPIRIRTQSHLTVRRYSSVTDETGTLLVLDTDYTVNNTNVDAVTITLAMSQAVLASTERLLAFRLQDIADVVSLTQGGDFSGPTLSAAISILAERQQELRRDVDRSIHANLLDSTPSSFPLKASAAVGALLAFDGDKNLIPVEAADIGIDVPLLGPGWPTVLVNAFKSVQHVATYAALTAMLAGGGLLDDGVYWTRGRSAERDGGQGHWIYDAASTATANGGTILAIDGGGAGRFFRGDVDRTFDHLWFGTNRAAVNSAIAAAPTFGGEVIFAPHTDTGTINVNKPVKLRGRGPTRITTTSTTADVFNISVNEVIIEDAVVDATVTRASGAVDFHISAGGGGRVVKLIRCQSEEAATAIKADVGFVWVEDSQFVLLPVYGVGFTGGGSAGSAAVYATNTWFAGAGLDQLNQPYAGMDLSNCGNGFIVNVQCLTTGYGILMGPDNGGQLCTSLFFLNVLADHCDAGWQISPANSQGVSVVDMVSCWGCTGNNPGIVIVATGGSIASNITITGGTFSSNGKVVSDVTNCDGISISGSGVAKVTLNAVKAYDQTNAADLSISNACTGGVTIGAGCQFGNNAFQSTYGVRIADTSDAVYILGNQFATASSAKLSITSTGLDIRYKDNIGLADQWAAPQVFTTPGANTFNKVRGATHYIVEARGGGGGGGGIDASSTYAAGGGGGEGGFVRETILQSAVGTTETATVGAGGTAGANTGGNGGVGGTSSFGSFCSATGGGAGVGTTGSGTATGGGSGGSGSNGDLNLRGAAGAPGLSVATVWAASGLGGGEGGGGSRVSPSGAQAGVAGLNGGGGSGAVSAGSGTANIGGAGGPGYIVATPVF